MKFHIRNSAADPLSVGLEDGVHVEIGLPELDRKRNTWTTHLKFTGSTGSHTTRIYGASALQSLMLAAQFAMRMYEPETLGN